MTIPGLIRLLRGERSWSYVWERLLGISSRIFKQRSHGKLYFEHVYRSEDPWDYAASAYEQAKYAETLASLPQPRCRRSLEIACSIGVFTRKLADRTDHLDAIDISARAVDRARHRCQDQSHVHIRQCDLLKYSAPEPYDLVLCAEMLNYLWEIPAERSRACDQLAARVAPGGTLVIVMGGDGSDQDWEGLLVAGGHFTLSRKRIYPDPFRLYRISLLTRNR